MMCLCKKLISPRCLIWFRLFRTTHLQLHHNFDSAGRTDKLDSSFSRSRSSSMSSLENVLSEAVTCLAFADSYTKKSG